MHFERIPWSEEAYSGLIHTFDSSDGFDAVGVVRHGVERGLMELWRVDGSSYAVTQAWNNSMLVWCYQGTNVKAFADCMYRIAEKNGMRCVRFATKHRALPRMLRHLNPVEVSPQVFEIGVTSYGK